MVFRRYLSQKTRENVSILLNGLGIGIAGAATAAPDPIFFYGLLSAGGGCIMLSQYIKPDSIEIIRTALEEPMTSEEQLPQEEITLTPEELSEMINETWKEALRVERDELRPKAEMKRDTENEDTEKERE